MADLTVIVIKAMGERDISDALRLVSAALNGVRDAGSVVTQRVAGSETAPQSQRVSPPVYPEEKEEPEPPVMKSGSFGDMALAFIRESTFGVSTEEVYERIKCASIPSAYQVCLELKRKNLIEKTPAGAWKAVKSES